MTRKRYLVSISGGRSSVMLSKLLIDTKKLTPVTFGIYTIYQNDYEEYIFVFANTSREKEETLIFMANTEKYWGLKTVWVEAVVVFKNNAGTKHRVTNFNDAIRDGSIFEDVIKKFGIPNKIFKHCTRELKERPIRSFLKSIGWDDYITIIGYRKDEPKRATEELKQYYPLYHWGINKSDVAFYWKRQPFDLGLIDADGNCDKCYKKSDIKILYQLKSNPDDVWVQQMESKYSEFTPPTRDLSISKPPHKFFRGNRSLQDIIDEYPEFEAMTVEDIIEKLNDKSLYDDDSNYSLIEQEDCSESCEAFSSLDPDIDLL